MNKRHQKNQLKPDLNNVVLLLGGNLGNRLEMIKTAKQFIENQIGTIVSCSSLYESAPWGFEAEQSFLNAVLVVETMLSPLNILRKINKIESDLGRIRNGNGYASRTIDIDILFYNNDLVDIPELQIPHPRLHQRRFTLLPIHEILPNKIHPSLQKNMTMLLEECSDMSQVTVFE